MKNKPRKKIPIKVELSAEEIASLAEETIDKMPNEHYVKDIYVDIQLALVLTNKGVYLRQSGIHPSCEARHSDYAEHIKELNADEE